MSNPATIGFDLDQYPTLMRASKSDALIRLVSGPAGSAKTSWAIAETLRRSLLQSPSPIDRTRYSRWLVVRNTYSLLKSNTIPSMKNMLGPLLVVTEGSQPSGRIRAALGDGTKIDVDVQFLALDSEDAQDKLLGSEPTFAILDETNMMPESVVFAVVRRLGRYPSGTKGRVDFSGIIGVFNGPVKGSWLHKWYMGERNEMFAKVASEMGVEKFVDMFRQPPALIPPADITDPNATWLPNPEAENIQNLAQGYGYYYAMLADPDPAKIQSYVLGEFADVKHGKVVFPEFSRDVHTFPADHINTASLREYYLSFDFGRTPVCLVGYLAADGSLIVLDEFMGEDMSVDTLYRSVVLPALKQRYPHAVCKKAWGDPAGLVQGQQLDLSPFDVLRQLGVPIVPPTRSNRMEPRLQAVRHFMSRLGMNGKPRLRVRDTCPYLIQALAADYIYEAKSGGAYSENPTKSHVGWVSDLCLAAGTLIDTPKGAVPIERIQPGDTVLTRNGPRRVLASAQTSPDAVVYDYTFGSVTLTATPGHPVFADGAFHAVDSLVGRTVYCTVSCTKESKSWLERIGLLRMSSLSMGADSPATGAIGTIGGKCRTTTMSGIVKGSLFPPTNTLGSSIMGWCQKGFMCTILTGIRPIMTLATSRLLPLVNMLPTTLKSDWQRTRSIGRSFTLRVLKLLRHGTPAQRARLGMSSTPSGLLPHGLRTEPHLFATGVVRSTSAWPVTEKLDFVARPAKAWRVRLRELITSCGRALFAERSFLPTNTHLTKRVVKSVPMRVYRGRQRRVAVYNLTVEGENEYFANGVLVHNCDALQYMSMGIMQVSADTTSDTYQTADVAWYS